MRVSLGEWHSFGLFQLSETFGTKCLLPTAIKGWLLTDLFIVFKTIRFTSKLKRWRTSLSVRVFERLWAKWFCHSANFHRPARFENSVLTLVYAGSTLITTFCITDINLCNVYCIDLLTRILFRNTNNFAYHYNLYY